MVQTNDGCEGCGSPHDRSYGSGRFCGPKCARSFATREKRVEINSKVRETLTGRPFVGKRREARPRNPNGFPPIGPGFSKNQKGLVAESGFVFLALIQRLEIHRPINPYLRYDFLVGGKKVQVKTGWREKSGKYIVKLVKSRRTPTGLVEKPYRIEDFDFLAIFNEDERDFWIIPVGEAIQRNTLYCWTSTTFQNSGFDSSRFWKKWDLLK